MNKALITGIRGQDGAYLAKSLLSKGYKVYGADRRNADGDSWRLKYLGIDKDVELVYMDLLELPRIMDVVRTIKPHVIYNLAAQSFVKDSFDEPLITAQVNAIGVLNLLESIRLFSPGTKFYQASTSEMFGNNSTEYSDGLCQSQETKFAPNSPYASAKLFAHNLVANYRESYDLFACCGILFNHESPLRGMEFVTRKITNGIARIKLGVQNTLTLGNLDAKRDWGYAPEYVEAMQHIINTVDTPKDQIVATGETHSIREFIECACNIAEINIKWKGKSLNEVGIDATTDKTIISIDERFYRPNEVNALRGKVNTMFDRVWQPKVNFRELVAIMLNADIKRVQSEM